MYSVLVGASAWVLCLDLQCYGKELDLYWIIIYLSRPKVNKEVEDLQREIKGFASSLNRGGLYIVCEKLKIDKSDLKGKSRFATVSLDKRYGEHS